ncbi:MAG TPA: D-alanyl-D-alanine carboxypeptidase family protein [Vampirovibrionales bacterium]
MKNFKQLAIISCLLACVLSIEGCSSNNVSTIVPVKEAPKSLFLSTVSRNLHSIPSSSSPVERRLLKEYGALWTSQEPEILLPKTVAFYTSEDTNKFQESLIAGSLFNGKCQLQKAAKNALENAVQEALENNLLITPRGEDSCMRDYAKTHELWLSRVEPNLDFYFNEGKLTAEQVEKVKDASTWKQVALVLELEKDQGLLFDKYRQTSILNSVAAPGTSQHLTGLAFDCKQYANKQIRNILAKHGWYQTIANDIPHFTFLGLNLQASDLEQRGLKEVVEGEYTFWVPDLESLEDWTY